ncbi:MAG: hypothetical protein DRJ03_18800 [Chloroflexi bacterium]|nr:MAG: hypothetical protein DRI81_09440 [Chloroflexota bacterium]RLC82572.1 MAG: hypothetical protein DRJ03_18800 [Chloroflexota bacterium]
MNNQENIRVLVAEDDHLVGETIRGLLEKAGYVVAGEATNGLEAVEMTQSLRPDVVLMDIAMPDMDGIEATRLIYERCPTPVVALTAYETEELVSGASEAGVGAYLVKPPKLREMERAITIARARFDDMMELRQYADQLERRVQQRTTQLEAQHAWLQAVLRSVADGIVVANEQGKIVQTNPVAQAWLSKTLSPEDAARLQKMVQGMARQTCAQAIGKQSEMTLELTGLDLELRAAQVAGAQKPTAVVGIHDVSHLKALNRMKARFVANVSHELRTPVTTIKLYVELMRRHPEKWKEYLKVLADETDHQVRLVEDILQISHIDSGRLEMKPRPTALDKLSKDVIADLWTLAQERNLILEYYRAQPEPTAMVDPDKIEQVLSNLVENAIQYTPEGGKVLISTGKVEAEGRLWATVAVMDTGIGIPENELPHIFDRFFRGEGERQIQVSGTGLGLAIVQGIVELHGGWTTVESQVNAGTIFTVWLPLAEEQA